MIIKKLCIASSTSLKLDEEFLPPPVCQRRNKSNISSKHCQNSETPVGNLMSPKKTVELNIVNFIDYHNHKREDREQ